MNYNLTFLSFLSVNSEISAIANGISQVIDEVFVKNDLTFDIFIIGNENHKLNGIASEIVAKNYFNYNPRIFHKSSFREGFDSDITQSSLFLSTQDNLMSFHMSTISSFNFSESLRPNLIFYAEGVQIVPLTIIHKIIDEQLYSLDSRKYLILDSKNGSGLSLQANFIKNYTVDGANMKKHMSVPLEINYFDKKSLKWSESFENLKNRDRGMKHYYVTVSLLGFSPIDHYTDKLDRKMKGAPIDLFDIVAERGKFQPFYYFQSFDELNLQIETNLTPFYDIGVTPSMSLNLKFSDSDKQLFSDTSVVYREELFRLILTPPELFSSYEKILMPFDPSTWILLLITFLLAFIIVLIVNRLPRYIQNIIYGERVQMPGYNIISIFFGIGQTQLPMTNFPRFILMLFIVFCLIIRTAYQGVLFELITTDMKKSPPTSISELIEQNYTFTRDIRSNNERIIYDILKFYYGSSV